MPTEFHTTIPGRKVTFRDGTPVYAVRLAERLQDHPCRDFGLYLVIRWTPTWPAVVITWPDYGLPSNDRDAVAHIRDAFRRAQQGQHVEVGCVGALGRTGTVLACMAILAGEEPRNAVEWVRRTYDAEAVETPAQAAWVVTFGHWERVWCYYRNLVHAVYREVRHIGEPSDEKAKCQVTDNYLPAAQKCRQNRHRLKSSVPFRKATGSKTDDIIHCYESLTDLTPEDLLIIFRTSGWKARYGGEKWAMITEVLRRLKQEIDYGTVEAARQVCEEVRLLWHNSGPLVPAPQEWKDHSWVREKWPTLCEHDC